MHTDKPFSQACENNKQAILEQLLVVLGNTKSVLEIGSGSGQHAVHFAAGLAHLVWHTSDQQRYHDGINQWIREYHLDNLRAPIKFKIGEHNWPVLNIDAVFTANTAHIMQKTEVRQLMKLVGAHLPIDGIFCQYGPFTENGEFNSQSNLDFHQTLVDQGYGGYRDLNELKAWAEPLTLIEKINMPANNCLLVWCKTKP